MTATLTLDQSTGNNRRSGYYTPRAGVRYFVACHDCLTDVIQREVPLIPHLIAYYRFYYAVAKPTST